MAKENHIKAEPSSEDDYEMETDEEEEISDSDSEYETDESDTESAVTVAEAKDKEKKKFSLIDGDWFEKSGLVQEVAVHGVSEESVKQAWSKLPMEKKMEIANKWEKVEIKRIKYLTLKAQLVYEFMSAISDVVSST